MNKIFILSTLLTFNFTFFYSQTPSFGEIYDFNVGDVFQYTIDPSDGTAPPTYYQKEITSKYYSSNNDTIFYDYNLINFTPQSCQSCTDGDTSLLTTGTDSYTYLDSIISIGPDPIFIENMGEICLSNFSNFTGVFQDTILNSCGDTLFRVVEQIVNDSCSILGYESTPNIINEYGKGLGSLRYESYNGNWFVKNVFYYKKNEIECGTANNFLTSTRVLSSLGNLRIISHPVQNTLLFNQELIGKVSIYSINGTLISEEILKSKTIDTSYLASGLYFIKTDKQVLKFIKTEGLR